MTQEQALTILKIGANVFLTGEPGSGKTHTTRAYIRYLREHGIEPAITASTGIAATHINGMTIHSWSGIGIRTYLSEYDLDKIASSEYVTKRINKTNVLIIDEVSMLHANMVSMIDAVCRTIKRNDMPFGGIQVIFVGDFFQLPPITAPQKIDRRKQQMLLADGTYENDETTQIGFAYVSDAWRSAKPIVCYLDEQHRQDDRAFLELLNAIRTDSVSEVHYDHIMSRQVTIDSVPEHTTKLYSHNAQVDIMNNEALAKLDAKSERYVMTSSGNDILVSILKKGCLSPEVLELKIGATIMFTKNNPQEGFVNGTLGVVEAFQPGTKYPIIKLRNGKRITAEPMEWAVEENGKIKASITQIPLRLAWAMTVHKSQGMSLDAAIIDLSQVFEFGQGYVALSRLRNLSGLYLLGINEHALKVHPDILIKDTEFREKAEAASEAFEQMSQEKIAVLHTNFIKASGGTLETKAVTKIKNKKQDTLLETLTLWQQDKTIPEIAKARGLTQQTIFDHIEKLITKGLIVSSDFSRLLTPTLIQHMSEIHKAFEGLDTDKLTPVYEKFGGKYSYNELKIARILHKHK